MKPKHNTEPVDSSVCKDAAAACMENARRFLADAEFLSANERYRAAAVLAIYALDEVGKAGLLSWASTLATSQSTDWAAFWSGFRDHYNKIWTGHLLTSVARGYQALVGAKGLVDYVQRVAKETLGSRTRLAYVDLVDGKCSLPPTIHRERCEYLIAAARDALSGSSSSAPSQSTSA